MCGKYVGRWETQKMVLCSPHLDCLDFAVLPHHKGHLVLKSSQVKRRIIYEYHTTYLYRFISRSCHRLFLRRDQSLIFPQRILRKKGRCHAQVDKQSCRCIKIFHIGLLWCVYFLVLAVVKPAQVDYANNMAELIVAGLTVISILFAFVEFIRGKGDKKE